MANSGGGAIVYGVTENQKRANGRTDTGELSESRERNMHQVAVSAVSPPLFGLSVIQVGAQGNRAVVVIVPPSTDGPHLVYRGEYFGAPIRNNADTVWMREREIANQYRGRFNSALNAPAQLYALYDEANADFDTIERAWFIAVARPKAATALTTRWTQEQVREIFQDAERLTLASVTANLGSHPLANVNRNTPRPGLRRWTAPNTMITDNVRWGETWVNVHFDGSVTLTGVIGGRHKSDPQYGQSPMYDPWQISELVVEAYVSDFMALIRSVGTKIGAVEYEVRIGVEWRGEHPLTFYRPGAYGFDDHDGAFHVRRFIPVETTVAVRDRDGDEYLEQVRELALDCINQGGVKRLRLIKERHETTLRTRPRVARNELPIEHA